MTLYCYSLIYFSAFDEKMLQESGLLFADNATQAMKRLGELWGDIEQVNLRCFESVDSGVLSFGGDDWEDAVSWCAKQDERGTDGLE